MSLEKVISANMLETWVDVHSPLWTRSHAPQNSH